TAGRVPRGGSAPRSRRSLAAVPRVTRWRSTFRDRAQRVPGLAAGTAGCYDTHLRDHERTKRMSWNPSIEPGCPDEVGIDAIETLIVPRSRDLGGFEVKRALPAPKRQMVGPFIFFDQAGPAEFLTGQGIDVRPHPHIGLGTVTYLYQGDFHHRDSIGTDQIIRPGALNWMVAGKGVTHSERTSEQGRSGPHSLFGIQTWIALPEDREDMAPVFEHHGQDALPEIEADGSRARLILGTA